MGIPSFGTEIHHKDLSLEDSVLSQFNPFDIITDAPQINIIYISTHLSPPCAKVKNIWSYTSTPPIRLHGAVLSWEKHRDNYTLPFPTYHHLSCSRHLLLCNFHTKILCFLFHWCMLLVQSIYSSNLITLTIVPHTQVYLITQTILIQVTLTLPFLLAV
jgi:hypothetical protein